MTSRIRGEPPRRHQRSQNEPTAKPRRAESGGRNHPLHEVQTTRGNRVAQRIGSSFKETESADPKSGRTSHDGCDTPAKHDDYHWQGRVTNAWSIALRRTPRKDPANPHRNTIADLERGTLLNVVGRSGNWLQVEVTQGGKSLRGYVSCELVQHIPPTVYDFEDDGEFITGLRIDTLATALVVLKRAELDKARQGDDFAPDELRRDRIKRAISIVERTDRYVVNGTTFEVSFKDQTGVDIETIEDFIIFVETVERTYPNASPEEIASEIRRLRHRTFHWTLLVASQGIRGQDGGSVNIREQGQIADQFDLDAFRPGTDDPVFDTRFGPVDIAHVISGIDAALSGGHTTYPEQLVEASDVSTTYKKGAEPMYDALQDASGGDVRDFATWSGDLGQAYAEYLFKRWVADESVNLADIRRDKASDEKLRADIHGFIAKELWDEAVANDPSSTQELSVSAILRLLYLEDSEGVEGGTLRSHFEQAIERSGASAKEYVRERTTNFASLWFARMRQSDRSLLGNILRGRRPTRKWLAERLIEVGRQEFEEYHEKNEMEAREEDKLDSMIEYFWEILDNKSG